MPGVVDGAASSRKRKREEVPVRREKTRALRNGSKTNDLDLPSQILLLENQILESRKYYNNIVSLLAFLKVEQAKDESDIAAAISLCRVFSRLMAAGSMTKEKGAPENEIIIVQWFKERYREYTDAVQHLLRKGDPGRQSTALTLLMRTIKDQGAYLKTGENSRLPLDLFKNVVRAIVEAEGDVQHIREDFVRVYLEYDDIRYYMFSSLAEILSEARHDASPALTSNALSLLAAVETLPSSSDEMKEFYVDPPRRNKHPLRSLAAHKRQAQNAWLALLRIGLDRQQRKTVLGLMTHRIAPWFVKVELLMDFLTDSYNVGGSTSLLALSGLFYLIQEKNLDYPLFYQKLYSLLDSGILHSRHRSRFFRLLDTFLASTHLPAALVASFIKRLSRLTLYAPPAGIVAVIPWVYNLLKRHPTCAFMTHREVHQVGGTEDPFDMGELDPMRTNAIESSLWELVMLQSHFHPNVATLAKIISEQFTKQAYSLEDFLDHSYASMLDAELSKDIKKPPVVEYEIPKRIFTKYEPGSVQEDGLFAKLWDLT
ncbi:MAG: hypothetical protein M1837_003918 [Sclerophora amabilis]|nr:MAG: hypothetical protein M1837_003918 [Sclerophora amabilis]